MNRPNPTRRRLTVGTAVVGTAAVGTTAVGIAAVGIAVVGTAVASRFLAHSLPTATVIMLAGGPNNPLGAFGFQPR